MSSTLYTRLAKPSARLDELMLAVGTGVRSQAHFDMLEAEAQAIAAALIAAFRTPDTPRHGVSWQKPRISAR